MYNELEKFEIKCYAEIIKDKEKKESFNIFLKNISENKNKKIVGTAEEPQKVPKAAIALLGAGMGTAGWIIFGVTVAISIGVLLYTLLAKKDDKEKEPDYFNPQYGFDSVPELASYGEVIPVIYGKRGVKLTENTSDGNPFGGVRIGGKLINSRVETINGTSTMYNLYAICQGEIVNIDVNECYINNEPIKDLPEDVTILWTTGSDSQVPIQSDDEPEVWFEKQSQTIQINNNNTCSCHKLVDVNKIETWRIDDSEIITQTTEYPIFINSNSIVLQDNSNIWYKDCQIRTLHGSVEQGENGIYDYNNLFQSFFAMSSETGNISVDMITRKPRYKPLITWNYPIAFETPLLGYGSYFEFETINYYPFMVLLAREATIHDAQQNSGYNSYNYPKKNIAGIHQDEPEVKFDMVFNSVGGIGAYLDAFDYLKNRDEIFCSEPDIVWSADSNYPFNTNNMRDRASHFWYVDDSRFNNDWVETSEGHFAHPGTKFRIWISDEGKIQYWKNSGSDWVMLTGSQTVAYDDPNNPHTLQPPYGIWFIANHPGAGIKNLVWSNNYESVVGSMGAVVRETETTDIEIVEAEGDETTEYDIQKFNLTDIYQICNEEYNEVEEFRVIKKNVETQKITVNKLLSMPDDDMDEIWKIARFRMSTTKKVTDLNFNLAIVLYARYKPESDGTRGGKK